MSWFTNAFALRVARAGHAEVLAESCLPVMERLEGRQMMSAAPVGGILHPQVATHSLVVSAKPKAVIFRPTGYISGSLFMDRNGNGIEDTEAEGPVVGHTVYIDANNNGKLDPGEMNVPEGHTDGPPLPEPIDGNFRLGPLVPGIYTVRVSGVETSPNHPVGGAMHVKVTSNHTTANVIFPVVLPASIAAIVENDLTGKANNGAGNPTINNWTLFIDRNHDGKFDAGDPVAITNNTGLPGVAFFNNLTPGIYSVGEIVQNGWQPTTPVFQTATLEWGDVDTLYFLNAKRVNIQGTVFNDANKDGRQDNGELGIIGQFAFLDTNKNGKWDSGEAYAYTNAQGHFSFNNLPFGSYVVRVTAAAGDKFTSTGVATVTLKPGETTRPILFGETAIG